MAVHIFKSGQDDNRIAVARHIGKILNGNGQESALARAPAGDFVESANAALNDSEALAALFLKQVPLILEKVEPQDTECCLNTICHVVAGADTPEATKRLALQMCDTLSSDTAHRTGPRIAAMLELFAIVAAPPVKYAIILKLLEYAVDAKIATLAASLHGKAEIWERQWSLKPAEAIPLFAAVAAVLDTHPSPILKKEAFVLRSKALLLCPASDSETLKMLKPVAHATALSFIANSMLFVCDCFQAAPMQALKGDPEAHAAYELLDIMLRGDLSAFHVGSFGPVLQAADTNEEACQEKMRMMALVALCAEREGTDVTFAEVSKSLQLEGDEAEAWIVRAFGKQLLDGRIDQVQEAVHVRRCERLVFGNEEWKRLLNDLQTWDDNLQGIAVTMQESTLLTPTSP